MGARADSQNAAFHTISCKQYALPNQSNPPAIQKKTLRAEVITDVISPTRSNPSRSIPSNSDYKCLRTYVRTQITLVRAYVVFYLSSYITYVYCIVHGDDNYGADNDL